LNKGGKSSRARKKPKVPDGLVYSWLLDRMHDCYHTLR
jgi:hypothetical protein